MSDETWVVALPKLGESVTEGVIGSIFKQVGDEVEFDDPLFEVSTDKVDSEIPSPYDGVILEVLAQPGTRSVTRSSNSQNRRKSPRGAVSALATGGDRRPPSPPYRARRHAVLGATPPMRR